MKNNIRILREKLGFTQENLAEKVGVTRQTIIALEKGRYNPSLELAYRITKALKKEHIEDVFILEDQP
ncbi:MAG TPA: helix-turn-helix transcriptional regulator [Methanothermobacter sp.]|mgnify:CR=1 FL=1|nr:transcriptional regulator [Methanothermobacter sp. MT-2]HHW04779.1 helix-turn-helix transcriptional regulator [Methanothermobacter sp.]HOK72210.1 helix-turn-helix transcriptional regulator [Methanothermobacter sp.]HOL68523.1 helix-turn-helix transcriptional regulator [Methanothermobacter sp.]HPQ04282.1 helix-turn-helix transcriptional regulator [Methanothermobacter sp.]